MRSSIPLSFHCQNNPSKKKSDQAIPMLIVYLRAFNSATIYPSSGICFRLSPRPPSPPHSQDLSISSATVQAVHAAQSPSIPSHTLLRWKNSYCRLCSNDPLHRAFPDTAGRNLLFFFFLYFYIIVYIYLPLSPILYDILFLIQLFLQLNFTLFKIILHLPSISNN